jgi:hypothetical protein
MAQFPIPSLRFSQDLSLAALNYTTTFVKAFRLDLINFSSTIPITEIITITIDSVRGPSYDSVLSRETTLSDESSYVFVPPGDIKLYDGDKLKIQCTNANLIGVIYGEVRVSEIT